jgi:methylaspartate ammonia-lyase
MGMKNLRVTDVLTYRGASSYFFEDLDLVRSRNLAMTDRYHVKTSHTRFPLARTPATVVGVGLRLSDNRVVWGDAVPVSFGGKSGRAEIWNAERLEQWFTESLKPWIMAQDLNHWLETERRFISDFPKIPPFLRYAVSQALISAIAMAGDELPCVLMARELGMTLSRHLIPLHGSSGSDFDGSVDRMLARGIRYLPQGQFENLEAQIGPDASALKDWIAGFKTKAARFNSQPALTLDFHGALDVICNQDTDAVARLILSLAAAASPHPLHVESPIVGATFSEHSDKLAKIRSIVRQNSPTTKIVADEWANEVGDIELLIKSGAVDGIHIKMPDTGMLSENAQAVKLCKDHGVFALLGGSCTETDTGAELSAHLALATKPDALLVKPGVGFDESYAFLTNTMARAISIMS